MFILVVTDDTAAFFRPQDAASEHPNEWLPVVSNAYILYQCQYNITSIYGR